MTLIDLQSYNQEIIKYLKMHNKLTLIMLKYFIICMDHVKNQEIYLFHY